MKHKQPSDKIIIYLDEQDESINQTLKIGMSTNVSITTHSEKAIMVPIHAVVTLDKKHFVTTMKNRKKQLTPVTLGPTEGMNIRILSGLHIGDEVIVNHQT